MHVVSVTASISVSVFVAAVVVVAVVKHNMDWPSQPPIQNAVC